MLLAQISDLHVKTDGRLAYGVVDTAGKLSECVAALLRLDPIPDALLVTGDLVDLGQPGEYLRLKELLAPWNRPMYLIPGNHDERQALREAFPEPDFDYLRQADEFIHYAVDLGPLRLLGLDTVVPGEGGGALCEARLKWLDARLEEDCKPTLLMMHHPPFLTGIGHMDSIGLRGAVELEALLERHRHVERILCGHLHRPIQVRFANTIASTCSSPAHQVALDLRAEGPDCFVMEPPGYQLHYWHYGRLVSHSGVLGDFPGPYPFRRGGVLID